MCGFKLKMALYLMVYNNVEEVKEICIHIENQL